METLQQKKKEFSRRQRIFEDVPLSVLFGHMTDVQTHGRHHLWVPDNSHIYSNVFITGFVGSTFVLFRVPACTGHIIYFRNHPGREEDGLVDFAYGYTFVRVCLWGRGGGGDCKYIWNCLASLSTMFFLCFFYTTCIN